MYYNTYSKFPGQTADPHVTASYTVTPYEIRMEQMHLLRKKLAHTDCEARYNCLKMDFENTNMCEYTRSLGESTLAREVPSYFYVA
jgi:hypothetical protein